MERTRDVLICGGGPAGASAAHVLARAGLDVLLLDRARFPRPKLCAGLLTWKTTQVLTRVFGLGSGDLARAGALLSEARGYAVYLDERPVSSGTLGDPFHFASRERLDALLLDRARLAGAEVRTRAAATACDPDRGALRLADGSILRGRVLLGADGARSVVRRALPHDRRAWRRNLAHAVEARVPRALIPGGAATPTAHFGAAELGYGWVFPAGEMATVGVCGLTYRQGGPHIRRRFENYCRRLGIADPAALDCKGHPLPYGNHLERPGHGAALLAGDAAGFVDAVFGEGIYYALRSGEAAGAAALAALEGGADLQWAYRRELERDVLRELRWSRRLRRLVFWARRAGGAGWALAVARAVGPARLVEATQGKRSYRLLLPRDAV